MLLSQWAVFEGVTKRPWKQGKSSKPQHEDIITIHSSWPLTPLSEPPLRPINNLLVEQPCDGLVSAHSGSDQLFLTGKPQPLSKCG